MLFTTLLVVFTRFGVGWSAPCDNVLYTRFGDLCYGIRDDDSQNDCVDVPNVGYINAMAIHPLTNEIYIIGLEDGNNPYIQDDIIYDRYFMKFTYNLEDGLNVTEAQQIGDVILSTSLSEIITALAFSCQGVPRLYGLTSDFDPVTTQYLYEIDYEQGINNNTLTELYSWSITPDQSGYGLFYNIETQRLYRIADAPITQTEIYPNDTSVNVFEVLTYTWDNSFSDGFTIFASYYNETHFFSANQAGSTVFVASFNDTAYYSTGLTGDRGFSGNSDYINNFECEDYATICQDAFSNAPSTDPTNQPTNTPSTNPSMLPSNVPSISPTNEPSVLPTEMPIDMSTTEDPSFASKNAYNNIILLIAPIIYLFYYQY